jgi:hypothetical protein
VPRGGKEAEGRQQVKSRERTKGKNMEGRRKIRKEKKYE